jgi:hypothetical protein
MQDWFTYFLIIFLGIVLGGLMIITRFPIKKKTVEPDKRMSVLDIDMPIEFVLAPRESKLFIVEEVLWGNTDNVYTRSILHRFDSKEERQKYLDGLKNYKFAYQHAVKFWDAKLSDIQPEQF